MDTNIKIQGIKAQIDNMRLQIENIVTQNYNIMNSTGDQLLILSMQMLNTGIQTFNVGKSLSINLEKYYEQLEKISNQIANLINMNYMHKQQQMMEQQIIQQQMIQQQIMQQQMMEQQKMQQPMIQQQIPLIKQGFSFLILFVSYSSRTVTAFLRLLLLPILQNKIMILPQKDQQCFCKETISFLRPQAYLTTKT